MRTSPIKDSTWAWDDLDHSRAAELISAHLSDAPSAALDQMGQGDFCLAFSWGRRVVRVARHRVAVEALRREACVLATIASRLPLTVPQPTFHAPERCPPFTVHDAVTGEVLTRELWTDMPAAAQRRTARQLAAFLRALHTQSVAVGIACGVPMLDSVEMARRLRASVPKTIRPSLSNHAAGALDDVLSRWSEEPRAEEPASLLHGDIAPGHILYDPHLGSLTGVIDFGDVVIGQPARDFIFLYEDFGPALLGEVVKVYSGEHGRSLSSEIRQWYLLEAVDWTIARWSAGDRSDTEHGLREITREFSGPTTLS